MSLNSLGKPMRARSHTDHFTPVITPISVAQPSLLQLEPNGPLQKVDGNIDTEPIRRLIESLGNVQRVNQVVSVCHMWLEGRGKEGDEWCNSPEAKPERTRGGSKEGGGGGGRRVGEVASVGLRKCADETVAFGENNLYQLVFYLIFVHFSNRILLFCLVL